MNKTLASLAFGATSFLAGCASVQELKTPYVENSMGNRSSSQIDYDLPIINLGGDLFALEEAKIRKPDQWKYTGTKLFDSGSVEDRNSKTLSLESMTNSVYVGNRWDCDGDGKPETQVQLDTKGPFAIKAQIQLPNLEGYTGVGKITQKNVTYFVPTPIPGTKDEIYTVVVRNEKGENLGSLIIPAEGSKLFTDFRPGDSFGAITIRSPDIYFFGRMDKTKYEKELNDFILAQKAVIEADKQAIELEKEYRRLLNESKITPSVTIPNKFEAPKEEKK